MNLNLFSLLFLISYTISAQTYLQIQPQVGYIVKNHPKFTPVKQPSLGATVGIAYSPNSNKAWIKLFRYPEIGVQVGFFTFGNPEILGNAYTIAPHFSQNLWSFKHLDVQYRLGTTLAYATKPYNLVTNPKNTVIGSHLNDYSFAELRFLWHLSPNSNLITAFHVGHFSNGNTSLPNLGINIPAFALGYEYKLKENEQVKMVKELTQLDLSRNWRNQTKPRRYFASATDTIDILVKKWSSISFSARVGVGITEKGTGASPKYPIYVGSFSVNRDYKKWLRVKAGIESFFVTSAKDVIMNQDYPLDANTAAWGIVGYLGSEFLMGRTALVLQAGPYLKKPYQFDYKIYTKLGIQFYLKNQQEKSRFQPYLGIYVHSHSGEADFSEISVGYLF